MIERHTVGVCILLVNLNVFFVRLLQSFLSRLQRLTCAFPICFCYLDLLSASLGIFLRLC